MISNIKAKCNIVG